MLTARFSISKHRARAEVDKAAVVTNSGGFVSAIVVQLHSRTMWLLTKSVPIVERWFIAQQGVVADSLVVQAQAVERRRLRSCFSLTPIALRHNPERDV